MAPETPAGAVQHPLRKRLAALVIGVVTVVLAGFAVAAPGFDAQRTPVDDGAVWVLQSGENLRYARVNLEIGELDIVEPVANPTAILQDPGGALVFTSNHARFVPVSAARPLVVTEDTAELEESPVGTQAVLAAGSWVVFRTDRGTVYVGSISGDGNPVRIDVETDQDEGPAPWLVDVIATAPNGRIVGWSADASRIAVYDIASERFIVDDVVAGVTPGPDAQLTIVDGRWALFDERTATVRLQGSAEAVAVPMLGDAVLQRGTIAGDQVLLAHRDGLLGVSLDGGAVTVLLEQAGLGIPAVPTELEHTTWAAWLGVGGGVLWRSDTQELSPLDYAGNDIGEEPQPVLQTTGARMALNDIVSGWVWAVPSGELILGSQDWTAGDQEQEQASDEDVVAIAVDPRPPVAIDDSFGVRAGATVTLPVLLNDHDPNGDVLTVVPSSLEGLDPAFGSVVTSQEDQTVTVTLAPDASGISTFRYHIEDGSTDGGLLSASPATVTLTIVPPDQNSAPVWCGTEGCTATKPAPQVAPGGSVEFDWLAGWIDPEGDPIFVASVVVLEGTGVAASIDAGRVLVRHLDPNSGGGRIVVEIAVSDIRGAQTAETLVVQVSDSPPIVADSFAVVGQAGKPLAIDPRPHMSGGSGPLSVVSAIPSREGRGEVSLNPATGVFVFTAEQPGSYLVDWTVSDGVREQIATTRVTLRSAAEERLSVAPVVAFVRPQEDATVDILPVVTNPAGRVLLLSDLAITAAPGASLFSSTVGRDAIRVSGMTGDLQPGLLGEVGFTVSDGTGRAEATAQGVITVYLLPTPPAVAPIAVDDAVTVRVGERVDVPVLANDVAVQGNAISLDPSGTAADAGLAFTTDRVLRYLAPQEPGVYTATYRIFSVGYPQLADIGTVTFTVLPAESNAAPVAPELLGRVISGGTVSIRFTSLGVDPDGDEVVLDAILDQPDRGVARLSADGRSITYVSVLGHSGEVSFGYRVRDTQGATGEGVVRVGVLQSDEDPSPIAYSDYVQVTVGADSRVAVRPLDNDVDPLRTTLSLVGDPVPNVSTAPGFEEEFQQALDRIESVEGDTITFLAGEHAGTFSYFYDVRNEFGDVSRGTIVLRVVRSAVNSAPIVADTILTAETRASFAQGVDVVSGKVRWSGGAVAGLALRLWGEQPGVTASGGLIRGELPERRLVIPFELIGEDFAGNEVTAYGFLVVPGPLDLPPTLQSGLAPVEVLERESVDIDLADVIVVPAGALLELDEAGVRALGQRAPARCTATGALGVRYDANDYAPWRDACVVPVRFAGQEQWTHLTVPIRVIPQDPQPELRSASLEISPGNELVYDLGQMTTWQGDARSDAAYSVSDVGSFEIIADASTQRITIRGLDNAVPGTVEVARVSITNYPGVLPAGLSLRVGPAPATLPKAGTATQVCGVAQHGTQCTIRVVGAAGEVNPLPRTPLVVTAVTQPASCPMVSFSVQGPDSVLAQWTQEASGARCEATFTVHDAQGRESAADRVGTVVLDFQGLPSAAASVAQIAHGDGMVRLRVSPGAASSSYPDLAGFEIVRDGSLVATCSPLGECPDITGLVNGTQHSYQAWAINSQGRALSAPSVTAWAYVAPAPPAAASWVPAVPTSGASLGWEGRRIDIEVTGLSADTASLQFSTPDGGVVVRDVTGSTMSVSGLNVGSNTGTPLTITPMSIFPVPGGGSAAGAALTVSGVHGIGAPHFSGSVPDVVFSRTGSDRFAQVSATAAADGTGSSVRYAIYRTGTGGSASCPEPSSGDWGASNSTTFSFSDNSTARYIVCALSVRDGLYYGHSLVSTELAFFVDPGPPVGTATYTIGAGSLGGGQIAWTLESGPVLDPPPGYDDFAVRYRVDSGSLTASFSLQANVAVSEVVAMLCQSDTGQCSSTHLTVTPTGLHWPVTLSLAVCVEPEDVNPVTSGSHYEAIVSSVGDDSTIFEIRAVTAGVPSPWIDVTIVHCVGPDPDDGP